jgi:hypothetical protein
LLLPEVPQQQKLKFRGVEGNKIDEDKLLMK